jgi:hypothetical protein
VVGWWVVVVGVLVVLLDELYDLIGTLAGAHDFLGGRRLETCFIEPAPIEAKQRFGFRRLLLHLHGLDASPLREIGWLNNIEQNDLPARMANTAGGEVECVLHFGCLVDDHQKLAPVTLLEDSALLDHASCCHARRALTTGVASSAARLRF